jgi:hypothetical protein
MQSSEYLQSSLEDAYRHVAALPDMDPAALPDTQAMVVQVGRLTVAHQVMREAGFMPQVVLARSQPLNTSYASCRLDLVAASTGQEASVWYPALVDSTFSYVDRLDARIYNLQDKLRAGLGDTKIPLQNSVHLLASTDEMRMMHLRRELDFNTSYMGRDVLKRHEARRFSMRSPITLAQAVLMRMPAVRPSIADSAAAPLRKRIPEVQALPERLLVGMAGKDTSKMVGVVAFSTLHLDAKDSAARFLPTA